MELRLFLPVATYLVHADMTLTSAGFSTWVCFLPLVSTFSLSPINFMNSMLPTNDLSGS